MPLCLIRCSFLLLMTLTSAGLVRGEEAAPFGEMSLLDESTPLQVGDRILYRVYEDRDPPIALYVNDRGEIDAPVLGWTEASGLTCKELAFAIKEKLEVDFYKRATVIIKHNPADTVRGRVTLVGEVARPGVFTVSHDEVLTVSEAILRGGGFLRSADRTRVLLIRDDPDSSEGEIEIEVNVEEIFEQGRSENDRIVQSDDMILVRPRKDGGGQISIVGSVRAPGLYELPQNQDLTLSMAIMRAGGFTRFANQRNVKVIRSDTDLGEEEKILSVNVSDVLEKGNRSIDPILNPGDIIRVEERWIAL